MRCYICDWTPVGEQSFFHQGLQLDTSQRALLTDSKGDHICSECEAAAVEHTITTDVDELEHEELEEVA